MKQYRTCKHDNLNELELGKQISRKLYNIPTPPGFPLTKPTVSKVEPLDAIKLRTSFLETLVSGIPNRRNVGAPSPLVNGCNEKA